MVLSINGPDLVTGPMENKTNTDFVLHMHVIICVHTLYGNMTGME